MTMHLALVGGEASVLISDSQGSTADAQEHGWQKQVTGDGFLLGGAGRGDVLDAVLQEAATGKETNSGVPPDGTNVARCIEQFLNDHVRPAARDAVEFLLAFDPSSCNAVQLLRPAVFAHTRPCGTFGSIGSGAPFVVRRGRSLWQMGIQLPTNTLVDVIYTALVLAEASRESLTVDDAYFVGVRYRDRTYAMTDDRVNVSRVPPQVANAPEFKGKALGEIRNAAVAIQSEISTAVGQVYQAVAGPLAPAHVNAINAAIAEVARQRAQLDTTIKDYITWYDATVGRPPLP